MKFFFAITFRGGAANYDFVLYAIMKLPPVLVRRKKIVSHATSIYAIYHATCIFSVSREKNRAYTIMRSLRNVFFREAHSIVARIVWNTYICAGGIILPGAWRENCFFSREEKYVYFSMIFYYSFTHMWYLQKYRGRGAHSMYTAITIATKRISF